jgi:hypothetical protein
MKEIIANLTEISKKIANYFSKSSKLVLVGLLFLGMLLMILPSFWSDKEPSNSQSNGMTQAENWSSLSRAAGQGTVGQKQYYDGLISQEEIMSQQATAILGGMSGVGQLEAKVSLAKSSGQGKNSAFNEQLEQQTSAAQVRGVVVVAEGAGDPAICWQIYQAVQVLYDIPLHAVFVTEGKVK